MFILSSDIRLTNTQSRHCYQLYLNNVKNIYSLLIQNSCVLIQVERSVREIRVMQVLRKLKTEEHSPDEVAAGAPDIAAGSPDTLLLAEEEEAFPSFQDPHQVCVYPSITGVGCWCESIWRKIFLQQT
jgi:hypothetical protein